MRSENYELSLV